MSELVEDDHQNNGGNNNNKKKNKRRISSTSQSSPTSSDCNNTSTSHHNNMSSDEREEEEESVDQMMDSPSESTSEAAKVSSSTVIGMKNNNKTNTTTTSVPCTISTSTSNNNGTNETTAAASCSGSSTHLELEAKEKEISNLEGTIKGLEERLERQRDYDNIKRELNILKAEIASLKSASNTTPFPPSLDHKSLELYWNERTKALQSENAALKAAVVNTQLATSGQGVGSHLLPSSRHHPLLLPSSFVPPHLQNVEAFSSLLGEEVVTNYAKLFAKQAAASGHNNNLSPRPASVEDAKSVRSDASPTVNSNEETSSLKVSSSPPVTESPRERDRDPSQRASLDRLQTNLRANIEKYMNENLNTMNISRCVRELLSVHNIGQRLFAKYVLGLSQGTVSELLSKPKPWDKLTEKGRDSYRKMHAWAADESCIYELKSLVPRKGKEAASFKQDDPAAEERIQQILSEAQRAMVTPRSNGSNQRVGSLGIPSFLSNGTDSGKVSFNHHPDMSRDDDDSSDGGDDDRGTASPAANSFDRKNEPGTGDASAPGGIPSEVLVRLYQEELAKMIGAGQMAGDGRSQEEIRQALAIYHQELSRLSHLASATSSQQQQLPPGSDPFARLGLMNGSSPFLPNTSAMNALAAFDARRTSDRNRSGGGSSSSVTSHHRDRSHNNSDVNPSADHQHSSAFQLVRPKLETPDRGGSDVNNSGNSNKQQQFVSSPSPSLFPGSIKQQSGSNPDSGAEDLSSTASPLARMQSITNSLLSQSSVPVTPSVPSRPAKAVLPPITQQQFDQYNNLNTEDIVKHVKEQLSQFSISQRLFGESVLGLSQGSVSDLLARPKPWHMLTQKGREPFIRMKMFLEDESAVHKLVASQYKIAPEKLMRSTPGGFGNPAATVAQTTLSAHFNNNNNIIGLGTAGVNSRRPETRPEVGGGGRKNAPSPMTIMESLRSTASTPEYPNPTTLLASLPLQTLLTGSSGASLARRGGGIIGLNSSHNSSNRPSSGSYMNAAATAQPSVYEMAALTTDLDTQTITTKIKETLMAHNIGQKIFGEVVLGLSQGSVSELLSKPKPWHMLSIKGREPFIRMQLWLTDPNNIEKLQTLKNERREANKRRRTNGDDGPRNMSRDSPLYSFSNNSSGFSPLSGSHGFGSGSTGASSAKKPRILFSEEQKEALRLAFSMDPYPSTATIEYLAGELGLSVRTITNWFHNHRMRLKQVTTSSGDEVGSGISLPFGMGRDGTTFDPVTFKMALSQKLADIKLREMSNESGKGFFGSLSSQMYDNQNSCSSGGSSIQGDDDMGTLDLSMTNNTSGHGGNQPSTRSFDSDRSNNSDDYDDAPTPPPEPVIRSGSSRRKPQHVTSSSSRRKPAQPQWVDPGLEFSGDEDDLDASDNETDNTSPSGVINGVCIRQQPDLSSKAALEKVTKGSPSLSSNFSDEEKADEV